MNTTTTQPVKEIRYDAATRDFALFLNGQIVGYARSYSEGEETLNAIVYERLRRAA